MKNVVGLTLLDSIVVGLYLAVLMSIGVWTSRRVRSQEDYLLGGRRFGKLVQTFASFGQATSADGPVGTSTTTFVNGAGGIWSSLLMLFATPLFWITSPWFRRMRVLTMGDFFEERYGSRWMGGVYAVVASIGMMGLLALGFSALTKTVVAMTPKSTAHYTAAETAEVADATELLTLRDREASLLSDEDRTRLADLEARSPRQAIPSIEEDTLVWCVCVIVMIYAIAGGLEAAFYTDVLQGVFILFLSCLMAPLAWGKINATYGGSGVYDALQTIHQKLPQHFFDIFGSPKAVDFTWYYVMTASLVAAITVVAQPNQMVTNAAAKDESSARFGFVVGVFFKRACTLLWGAFGLAAIVLYQGELIDPDLVWGYASRDLLGPGLTGLMLASMLAALMSTADTLALTCSGLLLRNVYRPLVPGADERHDVAAGRAFLVVVLLGGALLATWFGNLLQIIKFIIEFFVIFAPAFWLGLKWRRTSTGGAWASILLTLVLFYLGPLVLPVVSPGLRTDAWLVRQTQPTPIVSRYLATEADVEDRSRQRAASESLASPLDDAGLDPLSVGEEFTRSFVPPPRSLFWSGGVGLNEQGEPVGSGYLYPELILLDAVGFDLQSNPHALNETTRLLVRIAFPFAVLIGVSLITPRCPEPLLRRFFAKMRTGVASTREADEVSVARAYEEFGSHHPRLLFPGTEWEIYRWGRADWLGVLLSIGMVVVILGLLTVVVKLGG